MCETHSRLSRRHLAVCHCSFACMVALSVLASVVGWRFALRLLGEFALDTKLVAAAFTSWFGSLLALAYFAAIFRCQRGFKSPMHLILDVQLYLASALLAQLASSTYVLLWSRAQVTLSPEHIHQATALSAIVGILQEISAYLFTRSIWKRVTLTEKAFDEDLGSFSILIVQHVTLIIKFVPWVFLYRYRHSHLGVWVEPVRLDFLVNLVKMVGFSLLALLVFRSFAWPLAVTGQRDQLPGAYAKAEASWSHQELTKLRCSLSIPCVLGVIVRTVQCVMTLLFKNQYNDLFEGGFELVIMTTDALCLLRVLDMFQEISPQFSLEPACSQRPAGPIQRSLSYLCGSAWASEVSKLAARSIPVEALLEFHARLGKDVMPHYEPWKSTTNDVVRQAVIPLTCHATGGSAYASWYSKEELSSARPTVQCMVTHTWSALFVDLVAAVVADALDSPDYSEISEMLAAEGHQRLRQELETKSSLHKRYWVCAFCINQHSSICSGFAHEPPQGTVAHEKWEVGRRDSVTGEVLPCCGCGQPKHFNDSPEQCELNKFDDLIFFLKERVPGFSQLIAIDRGFRVFTRIWCVAELVQAYISGVEQHVQLCSSHGLREDTKDLDLYIQLATLTVAHAEATRPEDRDAILAKIPNIQEFDFQLQAVIFGEHGLWNRCFVGFGVFEAAANIARRMKVLLSRLSDVEQPAVQSPK